MKKFSVLTLCLFFALNINAQSTVNKRLVRIDFPVENRTISFSYNRKNELTRVEEANRMTLTLRHNSDGSLRESRLDWNRGGTRIDRTYSYDGNRVTVAVRRSGRNQSNSRSTETIVLDGSMHLTRSYAWDGSLNESFVYDANNNLTKFQWFGSNVTTTTYEYNDDVSPFSNIHKSIPTWFWAHKNLDWTKGFWGKNTIKRLTKVTVDEDGNQVFAVERRNLNMPRPTSGDKTLVINFTYEYDSDGFPIRQYKNGELAMIFTYETFR